MNKDCPVIIVRGETLPEVWEKSLLECWKKGIAVKTEYDKPEDPPSKDCTMIMEVIHPFKEPRLHRAFPAGLEDLEIYRQEVLYGNIPTMKDYLITNFLIIHNLSIK